MKVDMLAVVAILSRHSLTWNDEASVSCSCGWEDLAPLHGWHLIRCLFRELLDSRQEVDPVSRADMPPAESSPPPPSLPRYDLTPAQVAEIFDREKTLVATAEATGLSIPTVKRRLAARALHDAAVAKRLSVVERWTPDCMSAEDYADWQRHNDRLQNSKSRAERPCEDCPASFASEMLSLGKCNGVPGIPVQIKGLRVSAGLGGDVG